MGVHEKVTISLPRELLAEIKAAVEAGDYNDTSEVIRDALRHWRLSRSALVVNDQELRRLVVEGRASGAPLDGEAALERLRAKYAAMPAEKDR